MDWLTQAKALPFGGRRKVKCCNDDRSMIINHGPKGYSGYCFRSEDHGGFEPHGELSIVQVLERRAATDRLMQSHSVALPADYTPTIPDSARLWLLKAGVGQDMAAFYGIGFSAATGRVIVPVYNTGRLVAFIARSVTGERPKYLARMENADVVFRSDPRTILPSDVPRDCLVVVEDILSAIRVGRVVPALAMLGTGAADQRAAILYHQAVSAGCTGIALWLDPDKAGRKATVKLLAHLRLTGIDVQNIRTTKDPKYHSTREIRSLLDARRNPASDNEA